MDKLPDFPVIFTSTQRDVLIGSMLGDGCLLRSKPTQNTSLLFSRTIKDIEYLQYELELFRNICSSTRKPNQRIHHCKVSGSKNQNKLYEEASFSTRKCPLLNSYHETWYPNGKKIVPRDLVLTPLVVAVWFCDDGFARMRGKNKDKIHMRFCSEGFTKEENIFLAKLLTDFCGETVMARPIAKNSDKYRITATDKAARAIAKKINAEIPISMARKAVWRNVVDIFDPNYIGSNPTHKNRTTPSTKDAIAIETARRLGHTSAKELARKINDAFLSASLPIMTDQYSIKYIDRLYKRGVFTRQRDMIIDECGLSRHIFLYSIADIS